MGSNLLTANPKRERGKVLQEGTEQQEIHWYLQECKFQYTIQQSEDPYVT